MTATISAEPVSVSRDMPGIGRLDFEPKRHEYWLLPDGGQRRQRLANVTSILNATWPTHPALLAWYAREGTSAATKLTEGRERGTAVHRWIERALAGEILPFDAFPSDYRPYLQAAASFLFEHQPHPVASELLVCHPEEKYAGKLDLLCWLDDQRTLLDFKTNAGGNLYAKAHVQTWAYQYAYERCGGEPPQRRAIVGLSGDGSYRLVESPDAEKLWGLCLELHREMPAFLRELGE